MAGKGTVTVRKTGRMCVFSLYFKALDRKGVRKVFQNNFSVCLFNNWQQEYNERNKKEQTPSQNYWPAHPRPRPWGDVCVCVCVLMCAWISTVQTETAVFHTHLQGQPFIQLLLGNSSDLVLSPSLPFTSNSSPVPSSSVWTVALHSKFSGKWKTAYGVWHPQRHLKYHLDTWIMFVCVH